MCTASPLDCTVMVGFGPPFRNDSDEAISTLLCEKGNVKQKNNFMLSYESHIALDTFFFLFSLTREPMNSNMEAQERGHI